MKKLILLLLVICLTGCSFNAKDERTVREFFAMDTVMNITVYDDNKKAALSAENEVLRLDKLLSISSEAGDIAAINKNCRGEISNETAELIRCALEIYENTDGVFDVTLQPLTKLWGFYSDEYHVPTENELAECISYTGSDRILLEGNMLQINSGMGLDLGGIAKGYASDIVADVLREKGVESAMISLGGNIYALGFNTNGKPWNIGIQDPVDPNGFIGVVAVSDMAVVTSGTYQRFFEADGVKYHHILDPKTGKPADSGLCSVTIICESGMVADGLSTALLVMGLDKAALFYELGLYKFEAVFVTDDKEIYITSGLEGSFTSNLPYEVVK